MLDKVHLKENPMYPEEVIKRDGTVEPFCARKINDWQRWASKDLTEYIDWNSIVLEAFSRVKKNDEGQIKTSEIQDALILVCEEQSNWPASMMGGRLQVSIFRKTVLNNLEISSIPLIQQLQKTLFEKGLMSDLFKQYSDQDYAYFESIIDHERDFAMPLFRVKQFMSKYGLTDRTTREVFETPQFTYMRMAMAIATMYKDEDYRSLVKDYYNFFSLNKLSPPTPNYMNLGTPHAGLASCCLYIADDTAASLEAGNLIAGTMTYMSAGIGGILNIRSIGDGVRNGQVRHLGKMPYYRTLGAVVNSNTQGGRGGAATTYFSCFDPEAVKMIMAFNPKTPVESRNRDLHFAMAFNDFFIQAIKENKDVFQFNVKTAPDLMDAFFSADHERFRSVYNAYEQDDSFDKTYVSARSLAVKALSQCHEVATFYLIQIDEVNRHTPHNDTIYSSNLCVEITQPTKPFTHAGYLYQESTDDGEVSLCSLAAIIPSEIDSDVEYARVAYLALKMVDFCIYNAHYEFPNVKANAFERMNAGIGISGVAHHMAKKGLKYNNQEGLTELHRLAERHAFHVINASLDIAQERGPAPAIHKTKWPQGWLPIDTYSKAIDEYVDPSLIYDWSHTRQRMISIGGTAHSSLMALMPCESSSKATGHPNGPYPIRRLYMTKTDHSSAIPWVAMDEHLYKDNYQPAWELSFVDQTRLYACFQKFIDQSISADFWVDRIDRPTITHSELLKELIAMHKYGIKTRYYTNSLTYKDTPLENIEESTSLRDVVSHTELERGCTSGVCDA